MDVKSSTRVTAFGTTPDSHHCPVTTTNYFFVVIRNIVYTAASTDILGTKHL